MQLSNRHFPLTARVVYLLSDLKNNQGSHFMVFRIVCFVNFKCCFSDDQHSSLKTLLFTVIADLTEGKMRGTVNTSSSLDGTYKKTIPKQGRRH